MFMAMTQQANPRKNRKPTVRKKSAVAELKTFKSYLTVCFPNLAQFRAEFLKFSYQNFVDLDKHEQERYIFLCIVVCDMIEKIEKI